AFAGALDTVPHSEVSQLVLPATAPKASMMPPIISPHTAITETMMPRTRPQRRFFFSFFGGVSATGSGSGRCQVSGAAANGSQEGGVGRPWGKGYPATGSNIDKSMCSSSVTVGGVASKPAGAFGRRLSSRYHPPMPTIIGKSMVNALGEKIIGRRNPTMKMTKSVMPKLFSEVDLPSEFLGRSLFSPKASSMGEVVLE